MKTRKKSLVPAAGGIILISFAAGCSTVGPTAAPSQAAVPPAGCTVNCGGAGGGTGTGSPLPPPNLSGLPLQIKKEADGRILLDYTYAPDMYRVVAWLGYPNEGTPKGTYNITQGGNLRMHAAGGDPVVPCGWDGGASRFVHCPPLNSNAPVAPLSSWGNYQSNTLVRDPASGQDYYTWAAVQSGYASVWAPLRAVKDQSAGPNGLANDSNAFTVLSLFGQSLVDLGRGELAPKVWLDGFIKEVGAAAANQ